MVSSMYTASETTFPQSPTGGRGRGRLRKLPWSSACLLCICLATFHTHTEPATSPGICSPAGEWEWDREDLGVERVHWLRVHGSRASRLALMDLMSVSRAQHRPGADASKEFMAERSTRVFNRLCNHFLSCPLSESDSAMNPILAPSLRSAGSKWPHDEAVLVLRAAVAR